MGYLTLVPMLAFASLESYSHGGHRSQLLHGSEGASLSPFTAFGSQGAEWNHCRARVQRATGSSAESTKLVFVAAEIQRKERLGESTLLAGVENRSVSNIPSYQLEVDGDVVSKFFDVGLVMRMRSAAVVAASGATF